MRKLIIGIALACAVLLIAFGVRQQLLRTAAERAAPRNGWAAGAPAPEDAAAVSDADVAPLPDVSDTATGTVPAAEPARTPAMTPPPSEPLAPTAVTTDPARILTAAAAVYETVRTLRADFTMRFENPVLRMTTTSRGTLYQQRPDRIALRFSDPAGDVIVSDGQHFWVYYPSVDAQQVVRAPAAAAGAGGVDLQAQFLGDPVMRFEHTLDGTETVHGRTVHVLTLVPRARAEYTRLRIWVDAGDHLVRRFEITEANGAVRRFDLENLRTNTALPVDVFRFAPPPGARVVDRG